MSMTEELEFLNIEEEAEQIISGKYNKRDFPSISLSEKSGAVYFNSKFAPLIGAENRYVEIFLTTNHVVFKFHKDEKRGAYAVVNNKNTGLSMAYPAPLRNRGIKPGIYKVYKCKDGFCIKRYEPIIEK